MATLNKIDIDYNDQLLGCAWAVHGSRLVRLEEDLFASNVMYGYTKTSMDATQLSNEVGMKIAQIIPSEIMSKSKVSNKLVYLPVLRYGNKMLAMNSTANTYLVGKFFPDGFMQISPNVSIEELTGASIDCSTAQPYPVDMSSYEVSYILGLNNMPTEDQYNIVFLPFCVGTIKSKLYSFKYAYQAFGNEGKFVSDILPQDHKIIISLILFVTTILLYGFAIYNMPTLDMGFILAYCDWAMQIVEIPHKIEIAIDANNLFGDFFIIFW